MSVNQHIRDYLSGLTPSLAEKTHYTAHRTQIEAKLKDYFGTGYVYETGSFMNGTGIRYHCDLDLLVSIPTEYQRDSSYSMLYSVKTALQERFPMSRISISTPAVVCTFSDGRTVEVTPAYYAGSTANDSNYYKIPELGGGWQIASPFAHNKYVTRVNTNLGGEVKKLIRLLKAIKYNQSIPISSFYLELRIAKYCEGEKTIVYQVDVINMLRRLVNNELAQMQDPTGVSGYISPCGTEVQRLEALSKLRTALRRAEEAYALDQEGKEVQSLEAWSKVFGVMI
jgi:hypothetical protein